MNPDPRLFDHTHRILKTHETLLRDAVRNRAFYAALERLVTPDLEVLDIGAGVGIWTVVAAKLGAKKVVAVEMDEMLIGVIKTLAVEHGVSDRVEVVCGRSFEVSLPREFDVVISETIGYLGYDENIVAIMADAKVRFLKDGGAIIPETVSLHAAAGHLNVRNETVPVGLDLDFETLTDLNRHSPRALKHPRDFTPLTAPACLVETDLGNTVEKPTLKNLKTGWDLTDNASRVNCFAVWVESRLTTGVTLDTRETTSWLPNVYRTKPPAGNFGRVEFSLSLTVASNYWTATFVDGDASEVHKHSPVYAAAEMLPKPPSLILRPATEADDDFLYDLYASTRSEEIAMFGWDRVQTEAFLRMQFDIQKRAYQMQYPGADHKVILVDGGAVGRTIVSRRGDKIAFIDIAVITRHRNRGIGTQVIKELRNESVESARPLVLHVNKTNLRARHLYERLGFLITGETELVHEMTFTPGDDK